jgi:hypothetical protein
MADCDARVLTPPRKSSIAVLSLRLDFRNEPFGENVEGL